MCSESIATQSKCDIFISRFRARFSAASRCDHHILTSPGHVGTWGGIASRIQFKFPKKFTRSLVIRMKFFILGTADENKAAGGYNCSSEILGAGSRNAAGR